MYHVRTFITNITLPNYDLLQHLIYKLAKVGLKTFKKNRFHKIQQNKEMLFQINGDTIVEVFFNEANQLYHQIVKACELARYWHLLKKEHNKPIIYDVSLPPLDKK
jgi:hypothetical protein